MFEKVSLNAIPTASPVSAKSGSEHKRLDAQIYDRGYDYKSHKKRFMIFRKNLKIFRRV